MIIELSSFDATTIPAEESELFEFKSGLTTPKELKKKLAAAASGFSNSGGGYFIVGVDANGDADGGIGKQIARQDLRDWADQIVNNIEPRTDYEIKLIDDTKGRGVLNPDSCILVVGFNESSVAPHMSTDGKYYVRAGAHTETARHFLLEAIWSKRNSQKPRLTHAFRKKPNVARVKQLGIVNLTSSPALNVQIELTPEPPIFTRLAPNTFPINVSIIDQTNPFYFDVCPTVNAAEEFGEHTELNVTYEDMLGNEYLLHSSLEVKDGSSPLQVGTDPLVRIANGIDEIKKSNALKG